MSATNVTVNRYAARYQNRQRIEENRQRIEENRRRQRRRRKRRGGKGLKIHPPLPPEKKSSLRRTMIQSLNSPSESASTAAKDKAQSNSRRSWPLTRSLSVRR